MYLIKERMNVVTVVAAAAVTQGDPVYVAPWFGVALNTAAIGEDLSIDVMDGSEVEATSAVAVAASVGAPIYWNPTTKVYAAASASGFALVGYTTKVKDTDNVFRFEKLRRVTVA